MSILIAYSTDFYYIDPSVLLENIQWDIFDILTSENIADAIHSFVLNLYNKKRITRWREDMNFIFSWRKQYFAHSLRSFHHS